MPPTVQAPGSKKGNRMEGAQGLRLRLVGSWTRVLITAAVLLVLWVAFAWLAATGHMADPNDPSILWAVKESGTAILTFTSKSNGAAIREERVRFSSTYWLVRVGDGYLIADSLIQTQPIP